MVVKLTQLARIIKNGESTLIWHKNSEYSLLTDGVFIVKISNDTSKYPKSLLNKLESKFKGRQPKENEWLMARNGEITEKDISSTIKMMEGGDDIHKLIDTKLIDYRESSELYARALQGKTELIFVDNEKFKIINDNNCKIFGSEKFRPVYFSKTEYLEDWEVILMPVRVSEVNEWIKDKGVNHSELDKVDENVKVVF